MVDDRDIAKLKEVFATKEDLERFATKNEFTRLSEEMVEIKFEFAEVKNRMDKLEVSLVHKIDVQADRLAGLITDFFDESHIASAQDEERDQKLEDHEKRLKHLEVKLA